MASTFSPNLRIELIGYGEQNNTWGTTTNTNLGTLIEQAIAGQAAVNVTAGNVTLTAVDGGTDQSRQMILAITGTPGVARTVTAPSVSKVYVVANGSNAAVTIKMATGTGVVVSSGKAKFVYCNGTDFYEATTEQASAAITNLTVSGNTILGDASADTVTINGTIQPGVVISGSSSSDALRITQTGTGNALVVEDSANPDATPFVINTDGRVGIGTIPSSSRGIMFSTIVAGSGGYSTGIYNQIASDSATTTYQMASFASVPTISPSSSFPELVHYWTYQTAFGAGATVTNQYGFQATNTLTGATNNYGFYSNLTSGAGRYNFCAAGTADNYFEGSLGIGVLPTYTNASFLVARANTSANALFGRAAADTGAFILRFYKSRSTSIYSRTIVANGDSLGIINFSGDDGVNEVPAAQVSGAVDGTPGLGDMPGRLVFNTTPDGSNIPTEKMRIDNAGNIYGTSGTTAMTNGFFYIPSAAGAPSGVPTAVAGRVPMYYDTTNNNFYVYNGAWKKVLLA